MYQRLSAFFRPQTWLLYFVVLMFGLLVYLPSAAMFRVGRCFGALIYRFAAKPRRIARKNVEVCFPELSTEQQRQITRASFVELGISVLETFRVWIRSPNIAANRFTVIGQHHLLTAMKDGKGVVLLSCHLGSMDLNAALNASFLARANDCSAKDFHVVYRRPRDKVLDSFLQRTRQKFCSKAFPLQAVKGIIRALQKGDVVWMAPDVEVKSVAAVFASFFGTAAATSPMLSYLHEHTEAHVIPVVHRRVSGAGNYELEYFSPLILAKGKPEENAQLMNDAFELMIRKSPKQYWWAFKKFQRRPEGEPAIY